ncbi:hypothetical protein ACHQM5_026380 [Ranunculus cassubicifolius]
MDAQPDIDIKMRTVLVHWLIEVNKKLVLTPESMSYMYIFYPYPSAKSVVRRDLKLVGISAMLIASENEDIWAPEAYAREQVLVMEKSISKKLEWSLSVPTPYVFLVQFINAAMPDQEMEHLVFFYAELGLMHYATMIYCPSLVSASSVYAARCTLNKTPTWNETLKFHTGYT